MAAALVVSAAGTVVAVPVGAAQAAEPDETAPLSVPGMPVSLAQAGEVRVWGDNTFGQATVPASLAGVAIAQVERPLQATLVLTADGRVVGWGGNPDRLEQVPPAVAATKVAQIAGGQGGYAGAVTRDGRVITWGKKRSFANPLNVPAGLTGVKQLAMAQFSAAALKNDGSVEAWGQPDLGQTVVPAGLKATAITALARGFLALTDQGTVVHWGEPLDRGVPDALRVPGNVRAISSGPSGALALLTNGTLLQFGWPGGPDGVVALPAEVASVEPVLLANGGSGHEFAIVDGERNIHYWRSPSSESPFPGEIPADLNGRALTQVVLGNAFMEVGETPTRKSGGVVIAKMLRADLPRVSGAVRVGSVLTGVPGTFSAQPDAVASEWLVGGTSVSSGAQLMVTAAMVGKTITYRSTATKAGENSVTSSSAGSVVPPIVVPPVPSSTKVVKVTVAKKAAQVTVTGKVSAAKSPTGNATVTITKGKKVIVTKTVGVSPSGAVKLTVKKFGKLAIKKIKSRSKTGYRGKYAVTIRYSGNKQVKASAHSKKFTVRK